ncbi:MAG: hypothetical protein AB3N14_10405, partial [Flavobacteriaceae bacterium]
VNAANILRTMFGVERLSQSQAMSLVGVEQEGRVHSGVDDATNLANLLIEVFYRLRRSMQ